MTILNPTGGANLPHKGNWLYWLYLCILCNKNGIKGLWGHKGQPPLGLGPRTRLGPSMDPVMALQYTRHCPLYIGYILAFYATKKGSRDSVHLNVHINVHLN